MKLAINGLNSKEIKGYTTDLAESIKRNLMYYFINNRDIKDVYVCMDTGISLIAAQVVLTYNRIFPKFSIWLTCIIPGRDRDKNFTDEEKELYQLIRDRADVIHTMTRGTTTQEIIHKSNMCMIDNTDQLLSYWNGHKSHSSVFSTINYADKLDKPITIVNPFNTAMRYDYRDVMTDTLPAESNIKHVLESAT